MGTFSVVSAYVQKIILILMPIAGITLIVFSVYQVWRDLSYSNRRKIKERLKEEKIKKQAKKIELLLSKENIPRNFFDKLLSKVSLTQNLDKWIQQADVDLIATRVLLWIGLAILIWLVFSVLFGVSIWLIVIVAVLIGYIPIYAIKFMAKRRINKLVQQLPDVFELISQALRAGHSLASGINLVGKQLPDPAGSEFARIFHEQNLGIKIEDALTSFAERTDQLDIRFFVTAVLIQRQTGGDLAEVLDKIGSVIRERIKILGQVKALTAEGRMSGWVLSVLPFFVFFLAWMMNPDYAGVLLYQREGQYMLGAAIFFQVLGMLMIKKIVNIKV